MITDKVDALTNFSATLHTVYGSPLHVDADSAPNVPGEVVLMAGDGSPIRMSWRDAASLRDVLDLAVKRALDTNRV